MADGVFAAEVVTPEQRLWSGPVRAVVLRSSDGFLTILDGHTDLVTDIVPGEVRVESEDGTVLHLAVHGGYLQVQTGDGVGDPDDAEAPAAGTRATRATVLAGVAELADDIDVARAERARAEAEQRLAELAPAAGRPADAAPGEGEATPEDVERSEAEAALRRAEVRLAVAGVPTASSSATS